MSRRLSMPGGRRKLLAAFLFGLLVGGLATATTAQAQDCDEELARAQQSYNIGRFDEAIQTLRHCLDNNQPGLETQARAYRLIGMAFIGSRKEAEAKQAIVELLEVAPGYEPDPEDNRNYVELVHQVRLEQNPDYVRPTEETEQKKGFFKKAAWGIGAAAGVLVAILVAGGGDDDNGGGETGEDLPDPPALPR